MNISDMHVYFRQYAQQMGMQNVRSILPEQIDILLNTSITDVVNQLVRENIGVKQDRANTDNEKISQINALSTLYFITDKIYLQGASQAMKFNAYNPKISYFSNKKNGDWMPKRGQEVGGTTNQNDFPQDKLYLVSASIQYDKLSNGDRGYNGSSLNSESSNSSGTSLTQKYPVRIIEESSLPNVLNDKILNCKLTSPILVCYNNDALDLYIGSYKNIGTNENPEYIFADNHIAYMLQLSYIKKPAEVHLNLGAGDAKPNTNCDVHESMHVDIVKHAVDLFVTSVSRGTYAQQTQPQSNAQ